jgi:hypothetical protein
MNSCDSRCSFVKTKYYIKTFILVLTAVVLTSVAITLLHLHQAQILLLSGQDYPTWTVLDAIVFLGGRDKLG